MQPLKLRRLAANSLVAVAGLMVVAAPALAVAPTETDPAKIMKAVDDRETGDKQASRMKMIITDKSGAKRERLVRSSSMKFKGGTKQLIMFESPADLRNTGMLTVDYDAGAKVDDQWLYLPKMRKTTRISSSKKSGSFMGSDLSFSDMTQQSVDQYNYVMKKQEVMVNGEACWLIESRPKTKKTKEETGYIKSLVWVSKAKLMPLKAKHWVAEGRKLKFMVFSKIKKIDGVWIAKKISAMTKQSGEKLSQTVLLFANISFNNASVKATNFNQARLERGL